MFVESDSDPIEQFVCDAAGLDGKGKVFYVDQIVLRDRDTDKDGTAEERAYYLQNEHLDIVALVDDSGNQIEMVRYSSYGTPFGLPGGDCDSDGDCDDSDTTDTDQVQSWIDQSAYDVRGDINLDGTVTASDKSLLSSGSYTGTASGFGTIGTSNQTYSYEGQVSQLGGAVGIGRGTLRSTGLGIWHGRIKSTGCDEGPINSYYSLSLSKSAANGGYCGDFKDGDCGGTAAGSDLGGEPCATCAPSANVATTPSTGPCAFSITHETSDPVPGKCIWKLIYLGRPILVCAPDENREDMPNNCKIKVTLRLSSGGGCWTYQPFTLYEGDDNYAQGNGEDYSPTNEIEMDMNAACSNHWVDYVEWGTDDEFATAIVVVECGSCGGTKTGTGGSGH